MATHRKVRAAEVLAAERERRRQLALDLAPERSGPIGPDLSEPDDERLVGDNVVPERSDDDPPEAS